MAYLQKEKILVAGDLVDSPVPYLYGGFPVEQIATLKRMNELDFETLYPATAVCSKGKHSCNKRSSLCDGKRRRQVPTMCRH